MAGTAIRQHGYVEFNGDGTREGDWRVWRARGKTFLVEWYEAAGIDASLERRAIDETIAVFPAGGGSVTIDGISTTIPDRAIAIIPPDVHSITVVAKGQVILMSPIRSDMARPAAQNERDYDDASAEGMQVVGDAPSRAGLQVIPIDGIKPPADKPRLKIVRSATMSVSWIEYEGLRDRTKLSPHDHADFEQGSLAIEGEFIHHLRVPWGPDATAWRDDLHLAAAPRSLCVIPPKMVHTTEGEGEGKHILLDIFAPARADFIGKGWVFNQDAYRTEA
ncbi:hypothetical protein ILFOPFJJ_03040 [Ensifer psoraleae]|uniref:hypothetical protein n=1 Tax=Sinorhizobium psoraleae TaxID=520838 RepID=UPI001567D30A|nr:hypothetical protein [Sinorhizobium psoraleae]NRP72144.1 hypothetical protein [Sinorhizobium psoraleae]